MEVSVGVITHQDRALHELVESIMAQRPRNAEISEIIVVASSILPICEARLKELAEADRRLLVVRERDWCGKAAAINTFLSMARGDVCVIASGDIRMESDSLQELVAPLSEAATGMTGGRMIPSNDPSTFIGFLVHFVWRIHHQMCLLRPKAGEMIAFKRVISSISPQTAVDEAWIESLISEKGYAIRYVPSAMAYNMGPCTLADYVRQRKRIHIGHVRLKAERGYGASSLVYPTVLRALWRSMIFKPKAVWWSLVAILLEIAIRAMADFDTLVLGKNPYCWDISWSAKMD
jgi:cellulose synthase/poly-beta-1,6-N-acetylglucosamine synthase-like glycosyltransferase